MTINLTANPDSNWNLVENVIANQKAKACTTLDLTVLGDQLPANFYDLIWLECIHVSLDTTISFSRKLSQFHNLREFYIHGNKCQVKFASKTELSQLKLFRMEYIRETRIPDFLAQCDSLEYLAVVNSQIKTIPSFVGKLNKLQYLILEDNEISSIPKFLAKATKLKSLFLNGNKIIEIPDFICNMKSLTAFHIQKNPLITIPKCLLSQKDLEFWFDPINTPK